MVAILVFLLTALTIAVIYTLGNANGYVPTKSLRKRVFVSFLLWPCRVTEPFRDCRLTPAGGCTIIVWAAGSWATKCLSGNFLGVIIVEACWLFLAQLFYNLLDSRAN